MNLDKRLIIRISIIVISIIVGLVLTIYGLKDIDDGDNRLEIYTSNNEHMSVMDIRPDISTQIINRVIFYQNIKHLIKVTVLTTIGLAFLINSIWHTYIILKNKEAK